MRNAPQLPEAAVAWELRAAWALGAEVALSIEARPARRGYVEYVSSSNAFALIWDGEGELHVPLALVRAVRRPHFSEPGWGAPVPRRGYKGPRACLPLPGQLSLDVHGSA